jgi:Uma2 family endonuclease
MSMVAERKVPLPKVKLIESDGIPLETDWHVLEIGLLRDLVTYWFRDRTDYYAGGNMFIYYSEEQARNKDYRGPDFFYVDGVSLTPLRPYWAVWLEGGRYPDLIIELLSPTTAKIDRTTKKKLYERTFRTYEYFCYDPDTQKLEGWRLGERGRYRSIPVNERGWMWSEELQLWLGTWEGKHVRHKGVWLRFFDANSQLVPTREEAAEAAEAELARLKAELAEFKQKNGKRGRNGKS